MQILFALPRFYPVLDTAVLQERSSCDAVTAANALADAGSRILQYRHKDAWAQTHYDEAVRIAELCGKHGILFVLNDRADYAKLMGAALHIGQDDIPPMAARKLLDDEVIGYSTHNTRQLADAAEAPVEYLSIGPIFATTSKARPDPLVGVEGVKKARPRTGKPLVAIGGIAIDNARQVLDAGADSVAVISGMFADGCDATEIRQRTERWIHLTS